MSSILTNNSATNALATLRGINKSLNQTQDRISSGLKVSSGKDNAAYFSISQTMKGDSGMTKSINEGLTLAKNVVSTGRLGAETVSGLVSQFSERIAFASNGGGDRAKVQEELTELVSRMNTAISQSSFNGASAVDAATARPVPADPDDIQAAEQTAMDTWDAANTMSLTTGIKRTDTGIEATTISVSKVSLQSIATTLGNIDISSATDAEMQGHIATVAGELEKAVAGATSLGVAEKSIETQQEFLTALSDRIDSGIGSMVDANMEEEAARLQALQVQQQLSSQALSIANQAPQNILSLFR